MFVPFVDLQSQIKEIRDEINDSIQRVLDSARFALGNEVDLFEKEFAQYCHASHGIAVNSGTSALHLALLAAGVGPGDEVITVPNSFVATTAAIVYTGAKPVFVDICKNTLNMDVNKIAEVIGERTKAILPVHLFGQPADISKIIDIAHSNGLLVIEDAAQAHGAEFKNRRVGSIGDLGCFSFYPGKNLGACGEGGMVVTNHEKMAEKIRRLRDWGSSRKYYHEQKGFNYRMDNLQGAILRVKLNHLDRWTNARRHHAQQYDTLLNNNLLQKINTISQVRHVYHIYAVRVPERDRIKEELMNQGISTGIHYPIPIHCQEAYRDIGYSKGDFPDAEKASDELISLPMYAELNESQIDYVAEKMTDILNNL